jgi:succinoglycan biosynthesis transport protein ExoP
MSLVQFLRIVWARSWVILAATISCVAGAAIVIVIVPPRWEANSRVLLNLLKPDPVTGQVIAVNATRAYVATQTELIKDYSVAGQVADQLGWLSDPELIQQYRQRPPNDVRDFRHWLAQLVIDRTKANVLEGSNILEITYTATTPDNAKVVADALRKAYIDASLAFRRDDANQNADWYAQQADKAKMDLTTAESAKAAYERENGIILQDDKTDLQTARLRALATARDSTGPAAAAVASAPSAASIQLAQIDAEIAQASQSLGPNHPELQGLRAKRTAIASLIADDRANAAARGTEAGTVKAAGAAVLDRAVEAQKALVFAERDKLARLNQLQAEVDLRRDLYNKTAARTAELRQEAAVADPGLTVLGSAVTPQSPVFPNKPLIYLGSIGLGLAMGVLLALLTELFNRRVRGIEDLQSAVDIPVLAVIPAPGRRVEREAPQPRARQIRAARHKMLRA